MRNRFNNTQESTLRKDPDYLTPGQLVDLVRQREKYHKDLNVVATNYLPFDCEVQVPTPKEPEHLEEKLSQLYRFIEDQKEMERRAKLKKEVQSSFQSYSSTDYEYPQNLAQIEMGIKGDGSVLQGQGLSFSYQRGDEDIYQQFRKQQSQAYYNNLEVSKYKK